MHIKKYFIKIVVGDHNVNTSALNNLILSSGNAIVIYIWYTSIITVSGYNISNEFIFKSNILIYAEEYDL